MVFSGTMFMVGHNRDKIIEARCTQGLFRAASRGTACRLSVHWQAKSFLKKMILFWTQTVWDAYETHQKWIQDPKYNKILDVFAPVNKGVLGVLHFEFQGHLDEAFSKDVTEVGRFTTKEGKVKAEVDEFLTSWMDQLGRRDLHAKGGCIEKPEVVGLFVGYDSVEVSCFLGFGWEYFFWCAVGVWQQHGNLAKEALALPENLEIIKNARSIFDSEYKHVKLVKMV